MKIGYFKKYPRHVYGICFQKKHLTGMLQQGWILIIYYGKKYRYFSNYYRN